jgi:NAD(P) transhydrogenase subunit alpha
MLIYVPKETWPGERRVPLVPTTVAKLAKKGAEITVEAGMGAPCGFTDEAYEKAGAKVTQDGPGTLARRTRCCGCASRRRSSSRR